MKKYYFTFGTYPINELLHNLAVEIEAVNPEIARLSMFSNFGNKWALQEEVAPKTKVISLQEAILLNKKYYEQCPFID